MGMIEFKDVSFSYPNGFSAVEHVSFEIGQGEKIAIVGQNGAGKTTTVKMMNGLLKPTSGTVIVDDMDTKEYTTAQLSRVTGYVFQNPDEQIFHNTVRAEIEFGPGVLGFDEAKIKEKTEWAADICGLTEHMEENPYNLPLSIRKFVTIASVLAMDEKILVLDEPTAGQDLHGGCGKTQQGHRPLEMRARSHTGTLRCRSCLSAFFQHEPLLDPIKSSMLLFLSKKGENENAYHTFLRRNYYHRSR